MTGVSGAGIKPSQTFHYPLRYENMNAYKIAAHQHNFEVERELSLLADAELDAVEAEVKALIDRAVLQAQDDPEPDPAKDLLSDVYVSYP